MPTPTHVGELIATRGKLPVPTLIGILILVGFPLVSDVSASLILTPGTAFGIDNVGKRILQYDKNGNVIDQLAVHNAFGYTGIEVVSSRMFVSTTGSQILEINLDTGNFNSGFSAAFSDSLGRRGNNLIGTVVFNGGAYHAVREYTTTGTIVQTGPLLQPYLTGLDSDETSDRYFGGQFSGFAAGRVTTWNSSGVFLGAVGPNFGSNQISGLAYDRVAKEYWVATGLGSDRIFRLNEMGVVLNSFSAGSSWINGLAVVDSQQAVVPEPTTLSVWVLLGSIGSLLSSRRKRGAPAQFS